MFQGAFAPSVFLNTASYVMLASLLVIYVVAVSLRQEEPIPKTYISACAGHYPNFIFFRVSTISGSALLLLGWLVNHFFLKTIAKEHAFNIEKYRPQISLIMGMMGALGLMGSTANIDTGIRNGSWHQRCAATFFLFTSLAIFYNTYINFVVHKHFRGIRKLSLAKKQFITLLLIIQMWISYRYSNDEQGLGNEIGNIIEWTYSITIFVMLLLMADDLKGFRFVYESSSQLENYS